MIFRKAGPGTAGGLKNAEEGVPMNLFSFTPEGTENCTVTAWLHGNEAFEELAPYSPPRPAIVICPGGGYAMTSQREAEPVAKQYFAAGFHTFILYYSVGAEARELKPLCQLASLMLHIRSHAEQWNVAPGKIAVTGFSAGGHLACSLGTLFNEPEFLKVFSGEGTVRPDAMLLGYPVITADEFAHVDSIRNVSGAEPGSREYAWFGLDRHVDAETPPTFLWHTAQDDLVPVENSLRFAQALSAKKIPYELHILPQGCHGLSICTREVNTPSDYNGRWVPWSIRWLEQVFDFQG